MIEGSRFPVVKAALVTALVGILCVSIAGCASVESHSKHAHDGDGKSAVGDFSLRDLRGKNVSLSDYKNKVILIAFWGTWCRPCQTELSQLQPIWENLRESGFELLSISVDPPENVSTLRQIVRRYKFRFPVLLDQETEVADRFNPSMDLPFSVLLDRQGRIAARHQGYHPGDDKVIEKEVTALLAKQP